MRKKLKLTPKQSGQAKKVAQARHNKELFDAVLILSTFGATLQEAFVELREQWPVQRFAALNDPVLNQSINAVAALLEAGAVFNESFDRLLDRVPEEVRQAYDAYEETDEDDPDSLDEEEGEDGPVNGFLNAQTRMRESILTVKKVPHPAMAACEAACNAAETGLLIGVGMAEHTRELSCDMIENLPESVCPQELKDVLIQHANEMCDYAAGFTTAAYEDTCVEARQACAAMIDVAGAVREGRTLQ